MSNNEKKNGKNKLFKGSVAAAAGVALLLGGAGTFALWNQTADIGSQAVIDAGHLRLVDTDGTWYVNGVEQDPNDIAVVPGDIITFRATTGVVAHGDHLRAEFGISDLTVTALGVDGSVLTAPTAGQDLYDALDPVWTVTTEDENGEPVVVGHDNVITIQGMTGRAPAGAPDDGAMMTMPYTIELRMVFDPTTGGVLAQGGRVQVSAGNLTLTQVPVPGQMGTDGNVVS